MTKITTADCVQALVAKCAQEGTELLAEWGGTGRDYSDPIVIQEALNEVYVEDLGRPPTLAEFLALMTDPKNWKRIIKQKNYEDSSVTERVFDCKPFDGQFRGYVFEKGGVIFEAYAVGE